MQCESNNGKESSVENMFTGLVETMGRILKLADTTGGAWMHVSCPSIAAQLRYGESVCVNGACLTVAASDRSTMTVQLSLETLRRTSFRRLRPGHLVNLERAMAAGGRFGGHFVNGHVDTVGEVTSIVPSGDFATWRFRYDSTLSKYLVEKGSIAVDGVSLTISAFDESWFEVALIPTTLQQTTFSTLRVGDPVNIEVDVLAKYVENILGRHKETPTPPGLEQTLRANGYL